MAKTIFVTGGTGFLGGQLLHELSKRHKQEDWTLRALARDVSRAPEIPGVEWVEGDITDRASLEAALEGADTVYHCAAIVKRWMPDPTAFDATNVGGLRNVCEIAHQKGAKHIVATLSFFALGPADRNPGNCPITEQSKPMDSGWYNDYQRTKTLAYFEVEKLRAEGIPVTAVYPGVIYGPGVRTEGNYLVYILDEFINDRLPGLVGDGEKRWSYAYIDDVVTGHILAAENGKPGEDYLLGGPNATMREFFHLVAELTDKPKPTRQIPYGVLEFAGGVNQFLARLGVPLKISKGEITLQRYEWHCDSSKAEKELGYAPRGIREGLVSTLEWMRT